MADKKDFMIVDQEASVGWLEAFQYFFSALPADSGLAFVRIPHHESMMPKLLSRHIKIPVLAAEEGMEIAPGQVYVISANKTLAIDNGRLHIVEPSESRGHRMPIDQFFKSLSEDCGERAICVVLTGTGGSDFTLDLKALSTGGEVEQRDLVVETTAGLQQLQVTVCPFDEFEYDNEPFLAVIREMSPVRPPTQSDDVQAAGSGEEVNRQLEEKLQVPRAYFQSTAEAMEISDEELKSSIEELRSMNEELQSVNEKLERVNTELKNKVRELDQANSDLKNLYQSNQIATLFLDNELRVKTFTPTATELFRLIESDLNRPIGDIVFRFTGVDLVKEVREVLDRHEKRSYEVVHHETGNHYIMEIMLYRTVNNTIDGVTISFVDITDLKGAKQNLELRERMLTLVTDSVPVLISYIDAGLTYRYCNSAYSKWFGLQRNQIVDHSMTEVLGTKAVERVQPYLDRVLEGETVSFNAGLDYYHDGQKIVTARYEPHIAKDGRVLGFIAFVQDESERILRERKLARLAAIVNSSHEVIIGCSTEGVITEWNQGAEKLYGYSEPEAVGNHVNFLVPEGRRQELGTAYAKLLEGERIEPFETERLTKSGEIRHVLLSLDPMHDSHGELLGISAVAHDITDRVVAEDRLAELNENLEQQIDERTRQLHELTARMLSLEQRERKKFSQYLHDEIQQTLAAAKLLIEQANGEINGKAASSALSESLRLLSEAIANTRSMTSDMSPPLFFDTGIKVCLQWLARWAEAKLGLEVVTRIQGADRPLAEEAGYLIFRAIRELLINTSKHAEAKEVTIEAHFTADGNLEATVADRGHGFDSSTALQSKDTDHYGLLSIVEQFRAMKGTVEIRSDRGRGTQTTLKLPANVVEYHDLAFVSVSDKNQSIVDQNRRIAGEADDGTRSILIVDDQEDLRLTLKLMLEEVDSGYIFLEAESGEQALEMMGEYQPDLVLMDISMPGISGVEATRKIKEKRRSTAVIGLSMHEREDMEESMRNAGAEEYITKDSPPDVIMAVIKKVLEK